MKAIQLLINSELPPDLRDYTRELDSKSIGALMADVARKYPNQYERIAKIISDFGRKASYYQGETLTLNDTRPVIDKDLLYKAMDAEIEAARKSTKNDEEFNKLRLSIWDKYNTQLEKETGKAALAQGNNLGYSVVSGARGKMPQLKMMLTTPGLYTDADDKVIPMFIRNSFSEGLRPAEFMASTYGARKSVLCLHAGTLVRLPDGGAIPIKDIKVGQEVLGADKDGNTFPVKVINVYDQGVQPVQKYILRRGNSSGRHEIICTKNHKILLNDKSAYTKQSNIYNKGKGARPSKELLHYKYVKPIGEGYYDRAAVLAGPSTGIGAVNEPYALLLGILTGDGCLTHKDLVIRLSCADETMIADLSESIKPLGLKISDRRSESNFDWCIVKDDYLATDNLSIQKGTQGFVAGARMPHKQILINEGLAWCRAEEKTLPININKWDNESILAYVAGLISTDGSIYKNTQGNYAVSLAMTAKEVIFGLKRLLQHRFGIYTTEISFRDKGGFGDINSVRKNRLWELGITTHEALQRLFHSLPRIPGMKELKRQDAMKQTAKQNNPYPKARIDSVEELGMAHCYDIEVDHPDHLFVLDSCICVQNSTKRATAKGGDFCLAINTQVRMADGSVRNIQDIHIGEYVLGSDKEGNTFPTQVINTYEQGQKHVYELLLHKHSSVVCTLEHKFLVNKNGKFKIAPARSILCNDIIVGSNAEGPMSIPLLYIRPAGEAHCYDIEVEHEDHLFVLANGIVTSNSKQLSQTAVNILVTENNCGVTNGIDLDINDKSLRGRVLAKEVDGMPAGTVLDKDALAQLKKQKISTLIVRSPMTCQAKEGVCAKCMGLNAEGKFPHKGEAVGITAAQAIGEPLCLHEDTLVRMADWSEKKIKDIKPGDMVFGSDMNGILTPTRVVNVFHNGIREGYKTRARKGKGLKSEVVELISTKEHKVLSYHGPRGVAKTPTILPIEKKRYQQWVYLNKEVQSEEGLDEPLAAVLGVLIGDGCYNGGVGSGGINLSCYDKELEDFMRLELDKFELNLVAQTTPGEFRLSMKDQYGSFETIDGSIVRNTIKAKLIKEGMWGQGSGTKLLPASIHTWNNKSVAALIGGLIATDGWICTNDSVVGLGSNSKALLEGVKFLLEKRFGIYSNNITGKNKKKEGGGVYATNYTLTVSDPACIKAIHEFIPVPGCKQARLNTKVASFTGDYERGRFCVLSQEYIGKIDTWDIEVNNETHLFVLANGLIVSNTQMALNVKHQSGAAQTGKRQWAGFDYINQFAQSPETFPDKAILTKEPGQVTKIVEAPQGGYYVNVNNTPHYVAPGYPLLVKVGDKVEAGDELSEGLADPGEIVELKGLGEGRKYYATKLKELLDNSGMEADRRNTEMMARAALDHLQITDVKDGDQYLPDDVVSYSYFANNYVPPKNTARTPLNKASGQYLQTPILHYTIGTKITPKITKHLSEVGYNEIFTSPDNPSFKPHMVRLRTASHQGNDWLAAMHTSYLKKQLSDSAIRGDSTNIESNSHFAPRLAIGVNFGDNIEQTGKF